MKHSKQKNQSVPFNEMASTSHTARNVDRKAMQLCSQVRYALEYAINSVVNGEYGLTVLEVVPAPNTAHLLVFVQSFEDLSLEESMQVERQLKDRSSLLRTAVSQSIHRKKTPGLSFQLVPRHPEETNSKLSQ